MSSVEILLTVIEEKDKQKEGKKEEKGEEKEIEDEDEIRMKNIKEVFLYEYNTAKKKNS